MGESAPPHLIMSRCFTLELLPVGSEDFYEGILSSCFTEREKTQCRGTGTALDVIITLLAHHMLWSKSQRQMCATLTSLSCHWHLTERWQTWALSFLQGWKRPLKTSFPASISLFAVCQTLALPVCVHSWKTAAEVETLQPDAADRAGRGKIELLSICQDRSNSEQLYRNATVRTMGKNVILTF